MLTLFDDEYAPFTSCIGFVRAGLAEVTEVCLTKSHRTWKAVELPLEERCMPEALWGLLPVMSGGGDRQLIADCGEWSAIFSNNISPGLMLGERVAGWLEVESMSISASPNVWSMERPSAGRWGSVGFTHRTYLPGHRVAQRTVHLSMQGSRWDFYTVGDPLPFEDVARYEDRFKRRRLTSHMLRDYCAALGIRPFDEDFYRGPARLVGMPGLTINGPRVDTVEELRSRLDWKPGQAEKDKG